MLESKAGYIDARPLPPTRQNLLATHGRTIQWVNRSLPDDGSPHRNVCFAPLATRLLLRRSASRMGWTGRAPAPNDTQSQWGAFEEHEEHMP